MPRRPNPIIPSAARSAAPRTILHLPDALNRHPTGRVLVYARVSSHSQSRDAKTGESKLEQQAYKERREIKSLGGKVVRFVEAVEYGKLSAKRPMLEKAIEAARKSNAMICARDLSRLIRAESYHRQTNFNAMPTPDEIEQLLDMAGDVWLVTRLHPSMSEAERHSNATKGSGKCGRPSKLTIAEKLQIYGLLNDEGTSLADIAASLNIGKSTVQRCADALSPVCEPFGGRPWKDFYSPGYFFRKALVDELLTADGQVKPAYRKARSAASDAEEQEVVELAAGTMHASRIARMKNVKGKSIGT